MNAKKTILISGAGSGIGEGTAIGLAQAGHRVIAGVQIYPQVTALRRKAEALGLSENLRVRKLDILDPFDVENACQSRSTYFLTTQVSARPVPLQKFRYRWSEKTLKPTFMRPFL
jgi:NADP-dependent 3-hydroxy acid dehydrogenase YdfG